jgi:hypothetical protein
VQDQLASEVLEFATYAIGSRSNAPYVTLSVSPPSYTLTGTSNDGFTLTWNSNLSSCTPSATPSLGGFNAYQGTNPQGTATVTPGIGTYNIYVTCDPYDTNAGEITSTPVMGSVLAPMPPTASLVINPTTVTANQDFTVSWSSTNAISCTGSGGVDTASEVWGPNAPSGTQTFTAPSPGTYTFDLSCGSPDNALPNATAQSTVTVLGSASSPTVNVNINPTNVTEGQSLTVTWSSTNAGSWCQSTSRTGKFDGDGEQPFIARNRQIRGRRRRS